MSASRKLVAAAVLAVVAGVAIWLATSDSTPPTTTTSPSTDTPPIVETPTHAPRPRHAAETSAEETAAATSNAELPSPIDLDKCDRDLDLFGTVVDADGKGVAGARIATVTYPWREGSLLNVRDRDVEVAGPATRSARDGTFSLRLARGDAVSLRVAADGFAAVELPYVLAGERVRVMLCPGVRLVVVLTDATGAPVEGANVRLFNNEREGGPLIQTRGVSGADGITTFESLPPSAWLWIAPEHAKAIGEWTKVDLPASGELRKEIRLPAGRTITGTVRDATTRSAVAGARVGMNWVLNMAVTTKEDGSYELPGWTGKGISDIQVLAEGFAREAKVVGSAEHIDFDLQRGYAATGRVVDTNGKSVPGALVSLIASEMSGREQRMSHAYAKTDPDGSFRVTSLRVGMKHVLVVMSPGFARLRRDTPVAATTDDVALGDIVLAKPRRVEGVVIGADGTPNARVPVTLGAPTTQQYDANWYGRSVSGFTDDLGRFRFAGVAPGPYSLTARATGAPETKIDVTVPADTDVLDVKLMREATRELVFTVVDSAGHAVPDVALQVSDSSGKSVQGRTDAQGVGRVSVSPRGKVQFHVWPMSEARRFVQFPQRDVREDESNVRVVLEDGAEVTGRVVDPDGAPVAGANLRFKVAGDAKPFAQTDDDGKFRVVVPANGRSLLDFGGDVQRNRRNEDSGLTAHVEDIAPGADIVVRCERLARDRTMTILVVSPDEAAVEAATVNVAGETGFRASAKTDAQGRAVFANLPFRQLNVNVWVRPVEFLGPQGVQVTPSGQELRLVCRRATKITGTVVDESGAAPTSCGVQALRDDRYLASAVVDLQGGFTLLLPAEDTAPVRVQVTRAGSTVSIAFLDGVAPGAQDVRLVVKR